MPPAVVIGREAVILAGGLGTRLRSVISDVPKPMAPVNGRPFLEYLLASLVEKNITRVILSIGYLGDQIQGHFGSSFGPMRVDYHVEPTALGTGGALQQALLRCTTNRVYVLNGDTYVTFSCDEAESRCLRSGRNIVFGKMLPTIDRYGMLDCVGTQVNGLINRAVHCPGYINTGVYYVSTDILAHTPLRPPFSFERDFLPAYLSSSPFEMVSVTGEFIDIGVPFDYERAQAMQRFLTVK